MVGKGDLIGGREHDTAADQIELELGARAEAKLPAHTRGQGKPPVIVHADLGHAVRLVATGWESKARGGKVRPHSGGSKGDGPARCERERRTGGPGQQAHSASVY